MYDNARIFEGHTGYENASVEPAQVRSRSVRTVHVHFGGQGRVSVGGGSGGVSSQTLRESRLDVDEEDQFVGLLHWCHIIVIFNGSDGERVRLVRKLGHPRNGQEYALAGRPVEETRTRDSESDDGRSDHLQLYRCCHGRYVMLLDISALDGC